MQPTNRVGGAILPFDTGGRGAGILRSEIGCAPHTLQVKTEATDGYNSVQVGYQVCKEKTITKPRLNHLKKFGAPPMRKLKEYRVSAALSLQSRA